MDSKIPWKIHILNYIENMAQLSFKADKIQDPRETDNLQPVFSFTGSYKLDIPTREIVTTYIVTNVKNLLLVGIWNERIYFGESITLESFSAIF